MDSFLKRRSRLQAAPEFRNLWGGECPRRKLFEGAQGNAVGLAQGAIDGAGFGHAHLGVVEDQRRDIARMSIAVADEATALGRFIDRGLEDPEVFFRTAECKNGLGVNAPTPLFDRHFQQLSVTDVFLALVQGCGANLLLTVSCFPRGVRVLIAHRPTLAPHFFLPHLQHTVQI